MVYREKALILSLVAVIGASLCSCSAQRTETHAEVTPVVAAACPGCPALPPGTAQYVWEEPMVDVIDVPPGLDPDGVYYRPAHQEVVEIRQGRWKYYRKNRQ